MHLFQSDFIKMVLAVVTGGVLGFGYYRIVGCKSGVCPITRNPYISTIYGALIGLLWYLR